VYSILKACLIVRSMDNSVGRDRVFQSAMKNSFSMRLANRLYSTGPEWLRAVLLLLYGAKCYASVSRATDRASDLLFLGSYPSEKRVLGRVRQNLEGIVSEDMSISVWNCLRPGAVASILCYSLFAFRLMRFSRQLARQYSFMPACRIFSVVPYYARSKRLLLPSPQAVFIASQYAPESLALASAAHAYSKKVFFVNHANATWRGSYVPPIHADLVGVSSQAIADMFQANSKKPLKILFWPVGDAQESMRKVSQHSGALRVGIYLTALTNEHRLGELVKNCHKNTSIATTFVRAHPVKVVQPTLENVDLEQFSCEISTNNLLADDIRRTDLAICGNSTVATEILRAGRPVLYDAGLDSMQYDYNGYLEAGLLMKYSDFVGQDMLKEIDKFYSSEQWLSLMRYFDCAYQQDEQKMRAGFSEAIERELDH